MSASTARMRLVPTTPTTPTTTTTTITMPRSGVQRIRQAAMLGAASSSTSTSAVAAARSLPPLTWEPAWTSMLDYQPWLPFPHCYVSSPDAAAAATADRTRRRLPPTMTAGVVQEMHQRLCVSRVWVSVPTDAPTPASVAVRVFDAHWIHADHWPRLFRDLATRSPTYMDVARRTSLLTTLAAQGAGGGAKDHERIVRLRRLTTNEPGHGHCVFFLPVSIAFLEAVQPILFPELPATALTDSPAWQNLCGVLNALLATRVAMMEAMAAHARHQLAVLPGRHYPSRALPPLHASSSPPSPTRKRPREQMMMTHAPRHALPPPIGVDKNGDDSIEPATADDAKEGEDEETDGSAASPLKRARTD